jgi:hypothetical protein
MTELLNSRTENGEPYMEKSVESGRKRGKFEENEAGNNL